MCLRRTQQEQEQQRPQKSDRYCTTELTSCAKNTGKEITHMSNVYDNHPTKSPFRWK